MLGNLLSVNRPRRATASIACLVIVTVGQSAAAQTPPAAPLPAGEPARFLERYIGLTPKEIEQARQGRVVSKVLDTKDKEEVALFGIVAVDAPRDEVARRLADFPSFLRAPGRTFGLFSTPADASDVSAFVAESSDLDAIKACRPADCNVKMPTANIEEFGRAIDWSSPSAARTQVETIVRQRAATYVNTYRRGGTAAMVEYGDGKTAGRASDTFASLLAESPYLYDYVPAFHNYVAGYPNASLPGVADAIYWASDKMGSMRPILSINHVSVYSPPGAALTLMSTKQLYASHYFLGAFTLTTVLDRADVPGGRGIYYIVVQRMRFDNMPSGGLFNIRGRVIGRLHDALRDELAQRKASLEARG